MLAWGEKRKRMRETGQRASKQASRHAYQGSRHGHHSPLIPRLHDGCVQPLYRLGEPVEIGGEQFVAGEVLFQHVKELHQPRGDVLCVGEVGGKGHPGREEAQRGIRGIWTRVVASRGGVADAEEARRYRVQAVHVELVKVSAAVDEDVALEGLLGRHVVADAVVGEVVKDLHGEEEAVRRHVLIPFKYGAVHNLDLVLVAARLGRGQEMAALQVGEAGGDFDDVVPRASVDLGVDLADVVEDVEHHGAAAGAHFVDEEIVVGVRRQPVVGDEVPGHGLAVEGSEQLRRGMPQLAGRVLPLLVVEQVLELGVPASQLGLERKIIAEGVEVEGLSGAENDGLLGEIAVMGIVQAICLVVRQVVAVSSSR